MVANPASLLLIRPRRDIVVFFGMAALAHLFLLLPLSVAWRGVAAQLILMLPGILFALVVFDTERDMLVRGFLGLCGGIALLMLLLLALHAVSGPLLGWLVLPSCDLLSILLGWRLLQQETNPNAEAGAGLHPYLLLSTVLLIGIGLRLIFLGNADFQGDESRAVIMARDVVIGRDDALLWHKKGPVEILAVAGPMALMGQTNEWVARLPFALAGIGVLLGSYILARALFEDEKTTGTAVGLIAAAILALDGFLIAFSRIVQYQSILILMTLGAVWCGWRFYQGSPQPQRYLMCAAGMSAVALLSHYDGVFVLPVLTWLVLAGGWRRRWRGLEWAKELVGPLLLGIGLAASFYVPFVLHEQFAMTLRYLSGRVGEDAKHSLELFNNLNEYYLRATFYNTTFQINWLGIALMSSFFAWLRLYVRPRAIGWALALLLLAAFMILVRAPERFKSDSIGNWAIIAFGLPIAALAAWPATPSVLRLLVLWFGAPFLAEAFVIADPVTHFYSMNTPAAILVGLAVVRLAQWLSAHRLRLGVAPLALGGASLIALALPYMYLVFVRQAPEYRRVFPAARPAIYRASYGDKLPTKNGYFGFPHRSGWQTIGDLYQQGVLRGSYSSNEEELITRWYTRGAPRCNVNPSYYFVAVNPSDPEKIPMKLIEQQYHLLGSVQIEGVKTLDIYSREPLGQPAQIFSASASVRDFDQQSLIGLANQPSRFVLTTRDLPPTSIGGLVRLDQHGLDYARLAVGQASTIWFSWRMLAPLDPADRISLDVLDSQGRIVASGEPLCGDQTLANIRVGGGFGTAFTITADSDLPSGLYSLAVRLRRVLNKQLSAQADALTVGTLTVAGR